MLLFLFIGSTFILPVSDPANLTPPSPAKEHNLAAIKKKPMVGLGKEECVSLFGSGVNVDLKNPE